MRGVLLDPKTGRPERPYDPLADALELSELEQRAWKPRLGRLLADREPMAADGIYYRDTRPPFQTADIAPVTLLTTSLMLWPVAERTPTPAGYFSIGKRVAVTAFGKITTAATPGNLTVEIRYATTDAGGVLLATSAALTLIASQTAISWQFQGQIHCRATGSGTSGSLFAWGVFQIGTAVVAAGQALLPASSAAAAGVDTTVASGISLQAKRSGSTAETMTAQDVILEALN